MLKIVQSPHATLQVPAKQVKKIDTKILTLIKDMTDTLINATDPEGVGLAAPQVGESLNLFIIREDTNSPIIICINSVMTIPDDAVLIPKSTKKNKEKKAPVKLEGCLSLQDIWGVVHRYKTVSLSYMDEKGEHHTKEFKGFLATIVQHEYDHVQGILFPSHVIEQKGNLYKSTINKKGEMEFEEITL